MLLNVNNLFFNVLFEEDEIKKKIPIIFLHGFTGSAQDWGFIHGSINRNFTPICIDLIGHGKSSSPTDVDHYTSQSQLKHLHEIISLLSISEFILAGYSMGGRLATLYSLKFPSKVIGLILESTSFGIEKSEEREGRTISDQLLARRIESEGIESFIDYWLSLTLFDSLKNLSLERYTLLKEQKIVNNINGLKNTLLGFSTGRMDYLIPKLIQIRFQVLLIVGDRDKKFKEISKKALEQIPHSKLKVVNDSGHNVHFEKPEVFLKLINQFLSNFETIHGY